MRPQQIFRRLEMNRSMWRERRLAKTSTLNLPKPAAQLACNTLTKHEQEFHCGYGNWCSNTCTSRSVILAGFLRVAGLWVPSASLGNHCIYMPSRMCWDCTWHMHLGCREQGMTMKRERCWDASIGLLRSTWHRLLEALHSTRCESKGSIADGDIAFSRRPDFCVSNSMEHINPHHLSDHFLKLICWQALHCHGVQTYETWQQRRIAELGSRKLRVLVNFMIGSWRRCIGVTGVERPKRGFMDTRQLHLLVPSLLVRLWCHFVHIQQHCRLGGVRGFGYKNYSTQNLSKTH